MDIPGLGSFRANYESACFDSEIGVFYPAKMRIVFSQKYSLRFNGLASSLQRKLKIKESEAMELIDEFVENTLRTLSRHNYCRLEGIGYLIKDKKEGIIFKDLFWKHNKPSFVDSMMVS